VLSLKLPTVLSENNIRLNPIVSLFNCDTNTIEKENLLELFKKRDLRTSFQCYPRPQHENIDLYKKQWHEGYCGKATRYCRENGIRAVLMADDCMRGPGELKTYWNNPIVPAALRFVSAETADIADGIEVVDEIGNDPRDYKPEKFCENWIGCKKAWPGYSQHLWRPYSDYNSPQYNWPRMQHWRHHAETMIGGLSGLPKAQEISCEIISIARFYKIDEQGREFPRAAQIRPQSVIAQMFLGKAMKACRYRVYAFDWEAWIKERATATIGKECQQGMRPNDVYWRAFLYALDHLPTGEMYEPVFNSIKVKDKKKNIFLTGRCHNTYFSISLANQSQIHSKLKDRVPPAGVVIWDKGDKRGELLHVSKA
jgi:hypothetical protein